MVVVGVGAFFLWQRLSGSVTHRGARRRRRPRSERRPDEPRCGSRSRAGAPRAATLNGADFGAPTRDGSTYVWHLPNLADGTYHLEVSADRLLFGTVSSVALVHRRQRRAGAPGSAGGGRRRRSINRSPIDGTVDEPVTVTADGATVEWTGTTFHLRFPFPPAAPVAVTATDRAGNATTGIGHRAGRPSRQQRRCT